jgi:hypothetical protein
MFSASNDVVSEDVTTFLNIRMSSGLPINNGDAQDMLSKILESLEITRNEVKEQRLEIQALARKNETNAIHSVRDSSTFWANACERAPMTFVSELEVPISYASCRKFAL